MRFGEPRDNDCHVEPQGPWLAQAGPGPQGSDTQIKKLKEST